MVLSFEPVGATTVVKAESQPLGAPDIASVTDIPNVTPNWTREVSIKVGNQIPEPG